MVHTEIELGKNGLLPSQQIKYRNGMLTIMGLYHPNRTVPRRNRRVLPPNKTDGTNRIRQS